jgi:hypothetical protein
MASPEDINLGSPVITDAAAAAAADLAAGTTTLASVQDSTAGAGRKAVTSDEKTAVAALAAAQTTTIITRIGALEYTCANNVDPSVSGQAAIIGARCTTTDGTKCWVKYGAGDTQWGATHAITGTFGSNVATWDTTALVANLACDTLGPFSLDIQGSISTALSNISLRVNGAGISNGEIYNHYQLITMVDATPATGPGLGVTNADLLTACCGWFNLHIDFLFPKSGSCQWSASYWSTYDVRPYGAECARQSGTVTRDGNLPSPEVQSIGLAVSAGTMGAACVATLKRY